MMDDEFRRDAEIAYIGLSERDRILCDNDLILYGQYQIEQNPIGEYRRIPPEHWKDTGKANQ